MRGGIESGNVSDAVEMRVFLKTILLSWTLQYSSELTMDVPGKNRSRISRIATVVLA